MKTSAYIIGIIFTLIMSNSCKRIQDEEFVGAEYKAASASFETIGELCVKRMSDLSSPDCLDELTAISFGTETGKSGVAFIHQFSEKVSWTVNITGRTSGAQKTITGTSSYINETNCVWDGGISEETYRFFQHSEICDVVVTYLGSSITDHAQLKMGNFNNGPKKYLLMSGYSLVDDFDNILDYYIRTSYVDLNDGSSNEIYITRGDDNIKPVQGNFMMRLKGQDANNNTYLGGTGAETLMSHDGLIKQAGSDQVYFNAYIYGTGYRNTNIQIRAYEWDSYDASQASTYVYDRANNDQWTYDLPVDWTGWKLVSIKYSAFKPSSNPAEGGNGNRIQEPDKITSWGLMLQSLPSSGANVDAYIDQICITEKAPFKP